MKMMNGIKKMFLPIALIFCLLLTACSQAESETEPVFKDEGVDTEIEITGYTSYTGENADMFLEPGDKIAVISPSSTPTQEQTDATIKGLEEWGFVPVEGNYTCVEERTLQNCIDDLTWALNDPEIDAIFCVRGGYAGSEVMDETELQLIKNSGKLIIGYSDITIYSSAWTCADLPSIHACMSGAFSDLPEECAEAEKNLIMGQIPSYKCAANEYCNEGSASGILIGGNLSTFIATLGSDYDPTVLDEPYILFLEDVDEDFQHVHRCLTILKHMGVLDNAQAIIFGEWTYIPDDTGGYSGDSRGGSFSSMSEMISRQFTQELGIPVAFGFPAGHGDINFPLLMGEEAHLTVDSDYFTLNWAE